MTEDENETLGWE